MSNETPRYAVVHYDVRRMLNVTFIEYIYLDMVYKLSYNGWCYKSLENSAEDLGLTKRGMLKMKNRLVERKLLKKNSDGHLRVTDSYLSVAIKVPGNSVPKSGNSVPFTGELSSPKNNNRNTENLEGSAKAVEKLGKTSPRGTYSPAKEKLRARFKYGDFHQLKFGG